MNIVKYFASVALTFSSRPTVVDLLTFFVCLKHNFLWLMASAIKELF